MNFMLCAETLPFRTDLTWIEQITDIPAKNELKFLSKSGVFLNND